MALARALTRSSSICLSRDLLSASISATEAALSLRSRIFCLASICCLSVSLCCLSCGSWLACSICSIWPSSIPFCLSLFCSSRICCASLVPPLSCKFAAKLAALTGAIEGVGPMGTGLNLGPGMLLICVAAWPWMLPGAIAPGRTPYINFPANVSIGRLTKPRLELWSYISPPPA